MPSIRRTIRPALVASAIASLLVAGAVAPASAAPKDDSPSNMNRLLAETRASVAQFHDVDAAIAAGYFQVGECAESPDGAMGYHFMNPAYVIAGVVDPAHPPFLTYGPNDEGELELWSAEYWEAYTGQPAPMYGSQPFDGPMPGHDEHMPVHYDLHIWVGKHNPAGMFSPWNPSLHC